MSKTSKQVREEWEQEQQRFQQEMQEKMAALMQKKEQWDKEIEENKPKFLKKAVKEKPLFDQIFGDQFRTDTYTELTKLKIGDMVMLSGRFVPVTSEPQLYTLGEGNHVTNLVWETEDKTVFFAWATGEGTPYVYGTYHEDHPSTWVLDYRGVVPHIVPWYWVAGHFDKEIYGEIAYHVVPKSKGTYDQTTGEIRYKAENFTDEELLALGLTSEEIESFKQEVTNDEQNVCNGEKGI